MFGAPDRCSRVPACTPPEERLKNSSSILFGVPLLPMNLVAPSALRVRIQSPDRPLSALRALPVTRTFSLSNPSVSTSDQSHPPALEGLSRFPLNSSEKCKNAKNVDRHATTPTVVEVCANQPPSLNLHDRHPTTQDSVPAPQAVPSPDPDSRALVTDTNHLYSIDSSCHLQTSKRVPVTVFFSGSAVPTSPRPGSSLPG